MSELEVHVAENRRLWDAHAPNWVAMGEREWAREPSWGVWSVPESELHLLPGDMTGLRAIELGCGTGYISAWMRRRGAAVYAIDNSEQQIATARRLASEHGLDDIEWVHGNAETVPQPDGSFDIAVSEYGAAERRQRSRARSTRNPGGSGPRSLRGSDEGSGVRRRGRRRRRCSAGSCAARG